MDSDMVEEFIPTMRTPTPEFQPPPTISGRQRRFPRQYQDFLPNSTTNIPHMPPKPTIQREVPASENNHSPSPAPAEPDLPLLPLPTIIKTAPDEFGIFRIYTSYPSTNPDDIRDLETFCDAPGLATPLQNVEKRWWTGFGRSAPDLSLQKVYNNIFAPFLNATVFHLMNWFYSGSSTKSIAELQTLVDDIILAPEFKLSHLKGFNAKKELWQLDAKSENNSTHTGSSHPFVNENGWKESTVRIKLPCEDVYLTEDVAPVLDIPGVYHRSLTEVITTALQDDSAKTFHYTPFSLYWKPMPESPPERIYSKIYTCDVFLKEHAKIKALPPDPGPQHKRAIAAIMLWSDATHLAQFGSASLWPIYAFFGNQSKYDHAKPSQFAAHHIAYMPSVNFFSYRGSDTQYLFQLPDTFQDRYTILFGQPASSSTITHIKRELVNQIWDLLLDTEFLHAYEHGIVLKCADGIIRRIFPRIFTYSADYPEK